MHHHDDIDINSADKSKSVIVTTYNNTKGGVDIVDKLCASYNCSRNSRRWPMVIFYTLLNVAGINTQVIYKANNGDSNTRRLHLLRDLANALVHPHLKRRAALSNLPRTLKLRLMEVTRSDAPKNQEMPLPAGRCTYCG
ncbi:uncharacterized protein [Diabrotica undecimpunctata]|uniref:uncharacterized protein n=1 Tax=Diabrotica undecimpunctata TaxID=50387 RepID=UPI003B63D8D2